MSNTDSAACSTLSDKARFLAVRLEQALEITDAPVLGELPE